MEISCPPTKFPCVLCSHPLPHLAPDWFIFSSFSFAFSRMSYICNYTTCSLWNLTSFTCWKACKIHSCCCCYEDLSSSHYWEVFSFTDLPQIIYSPATGHWIDFSLGATTNIHELVFMWTHVFISLGNMSRGGIAGSYNKCMVNKPLPRVSVSFCILTSNAWAFLLVLLRILSNCMLKLSAKAFIPLLETSDCEHLFMCLFAIYIPFLSKGEKERFKHLNAEFQRIARRDKKA